MNRGILLVLVGFFFGNKGVPMLVHWIYVALIIAAYKYGCAQ